VHSERSQVSSKKNLLVQRRNGGLNARAKFSLHYLFSEN